VQNCTWDIVANLRRRSAEYFHTERTWKQYAFQASVAAADRKFRLSAAYFRNLPSAVFRRDPGSRAADTFCPTQTPPPGVDIVSRVGNPNKCI
jgi:hypothetical protein